MDTPVLCPGCDSDLILVNNATDDVDVCGSCGGLWLDGGELWMEGAVLPADLAPEKTEDPRICPRDQHLLQALTNGKLHVDVCTCCGGIFLDGGELEGLQAATAALGPAGLAQAPRFVCDLCFQAKPTAEKVVGEILSVCAACAASRGIQAEPELRARRDAESARIRAENAD
jgi:Zn-finger nucleic acid-binding protein